VVYVCVWCVLWCGVCVVWCMCVCVCVLCIVVCVCEQFCLNTVYLAQNPEENAYEK